MHFANVFKVKIDKEDKWQSRIKHHFSNTHTSDSSRRHTRAINYSLSKRTETAIYNEDDKSVRGINIIVETW